MDLEDLPESIDTADLFGFLHEKREESKQLPGKNEVLTDLVNDLLKRYSKNPKSVGSSKVTKSAKVS